MTLSDYIQSLELNNPPQDLSVYLKALWYDKNNKWSTAHNLIDKLTDKDSAWVHAYLHRKEGDLWNADYWYTRAGKKRPEVSLEEEWNSLVEYLLPG